MSDLTSNKVSARLRRLEKRVEEGGHYGFQQDIWKEAADELDRLTAIEKAAAKLSALLPHGEALRYYHASQDLAALRAALGEQP